jgi:hypothetical protein
MREIKDSLRVLFQKFGDELLERPLRMEAFLRDLHYDKPKEVSCLMEAVRSGVIAHLPIETSRDCQVMLAQKGGLTPVSAEWAIGVWLGLWKEGTFRLEQKEQRTEERNIWVGSVEKVLGKFRQEERNDD